MIKNAISIHFNHHLNGVKNFTDDIHVADYTEITKDQPVRRSVEFFSPIKPVDIETFFIKNPSALSVDGFEFNNQSFVCGNGNSRSQCEGVIFPTATTVDSWILFCELKYSLKPARNANNLRKAIKQLYKTRYYYFQKNIISLTNTAYLIGSIPPQSEPFSNFAISQADLTKLKRMRNIILRLKNSVEIVNDKTINVSI
ncbi:hypothetical protein ACX0HA_17270 [Flavobacterium hauense]